MHSKYVENCCQLLFKTKHGVAPKTTAFVIYCVVRNFPDAILWGSGCGLRRTLHKTRDIFESGGVAFLLSQQLFAFVTRVEWP